MSLETELRRLGAEVAWPETPRLAPRVAAALPSRRGLPWRRRPLLAPAGPLVALASVPVRRRRGSAGPVARGRAARGRLPEDSAPPGRERADLAERRAHPPARGAPAEAPRRFGGCAFSPSHQDVTDAPIR